MQTASSDNPYRSPQGESGDGGSAAGDRSRWGLVAAVVLSLYAAFPLLFGAVGLLCVPGILTGSVSIGRATTPLRLAGWVLVHAAVFAHGCCMVAAAKGFRRGRWRRGVRIMATGLIVPGIVIAAYFVCYFAL
jgi:hypothetical protein